ncbi:MAG: hypothetical protein RIB69_14835, partial [Roseovarius sp.]
MKDDIMKDTVRPVSSWENERVHGAALCAESLFEEHIERAKELRERQAKYEATLPTEPHDIISSAKGVLHPYGESYPEGIEEAMHLSTALTVLVRHGDFDTHSPEREAASFMASRVENGIRTAVEQLDRVSDLLERFYENLNRRGFPEDADCASLSLGGSDHVSTFAEGASCAVSAVYRG